MRMFQSVSGHSSEQSTAHCSSQPTVSQLKGVSDTISNWFENHRPKRTQISTVTGALLRSKLEWPPVASGWLQSQVFRAYFFNSCNIQGNIQALLHSTRSDARVKFDSGVIFLDQSQFFATHSNQWNCFILYIVDHVKWLSSCKGGAKGRLSRYV